MAGNLNDGNQGSYWESAGSTFPQWAQVDLGASTSIDQVVLKLPTGWGTRTQTLSVQGSPDGVSFSTIVASAGRVFNPASNNAVTINFTATSTRYVRVNITANTGWAAAQLSELEVYGTSTSTANLAAGPARPPRAATPTSTPSGNVVDGNQAHLLGERQQLLPASGCRSTSAQLAADQPGRAQAAGLAGARATRR